MTPDETALVLAKAALIDMRTIGEEDVMAWHEIVQRLDFHDALSAIARHYGETRDRLMPVDLIRHVEEIDRERRRVEGRRLEIEYADREIAAAIERGPLRDRSAEVRALVNEIRGVLPDGNPDSLRYGHRHWREQRQRQERIRTAEPNPHYDPVAAARLAEMNAAEIEAAELAAAELAANMDIPESEPTP